MWGSTWLAPYTRCDVQGLLTMDDRLNPLIERLAAAPTDHSLTHFEAEVARGVAGQRAQARAATALAPVRAATIGLALVTGVAVGGLTAASSVAAPRDAGLFAADLAPSTLLDAPR
jgi:hypothetical protein